jgi:hypothetical protein
MEALSPSGSPIKLRAPIKRGNRYCGPSVISAITGLDTGEAAAVIRSITGQRAVTGTSYSGCRQALRQLGYRTQVLYEAERGKGITLAAWLKQSKEIRTAGRVFLICAGWHWQIVSGRRYTCGRVGEVVSIRDKRVKRRARVARIYEVSAV